MSRPRSASLPGPSGNARRLIMVCWAAGLQTHTHTHINTHVHAHGRPWKSVSRMWVCFFFSTRAPELHTDTQGNNTEDGSLDYKKCSQFHPRKKERKKIHNAMNEAVVTNESFDLVRRGIIIQHPFERSIRGASLAAPPQHSRRRRRPSDRYGTSNYKRKVTVGHWCYCCLSIAAGLENNYRSEASYCWHDAVGARDQRACWWWACKPTFEAKKKK